LSDSSGGYREKTTERVLSSIRAISESLGYRLGIHGPMGPFPGLELGVHLEAPTNPVTGEFDLKLGLPVPEGLPWRHALSAGWGIGAWADNSWFLEYAVSRAFGPYGVYFNYRGTRLATQYADMADPEKASRFSRAQRLIHQAALGFEWRLPDIPVVPDFLSPQVILTYPLAPAGTRPIPEFVLDDRGWGFNLGLGWEFR
jgi:hypothetical protein